MPIYKDDRNVITPLFDQIRRITETEDAMTFERATESLLNVTPGDELPSAEKSVFGVDTAGEEYGIVTLGKTQSETVAYTVNPCNKYTANEAISIIGLRVYAGWNTTVRTLYLHNADGELVRETEEITPVSGTWITAYFDKPINIAMGESFFVSSSAVQYNAYSSPSEVTFNEKITFDGSSGGGISGDFYPYSVKGVYDFIIGEVSAELPDSYEVQRTTMDDIAEEVQRITGTESKMTTAQIVSGLQSVTDGSGLPPNAKLYYTGNAESTMIFPVLESSATGVLQEG